MPEDHVITAFKTKNANAKARWARLSNQNISYGRGVAVESDLCILEFSLPENFDPPVLFYYQLTNFYQNHRRYVASFSDKQLKGDALTGSEVNSSSCTPLQHDAETGKPLYPCGLIANSLFNDTFASPIDLTRNTTYKMENNTNIAWNSDKALYGKTKYRPDEVMPPPNWRRLYPDGYTNEHPPPNLHNWEAFMVWMRTAGLPTFSKLYQRNDNDVMEAGSYRIIVTDSMIASLVYIPCLRSPYLFD
jgi:hypothetical protein